jgi:hypothetical protein
MISSSVNPDSAQCCNWPALLKESTDFDKRRPAGTIFLDMVKTLSII